MLHLIDGMRRHQRIRQTTKQLVGTDAFRRGLLIIFITPAALLVAASPGWLDNAGLPW